MISIDLCFYTYRYCGHGSGSKYFPNDHLVKLDCRAAPILMGCSSGQLAASGRIVDPTGAPIYYLLAGRWCLRIENHQGVFNNLLIYSLQPWNGWYVMGSNGCRLRSFYYSTT